MTPIEVGLGHVLVASLSASSLLVLIVWVGLHANRAEAKAGEPPGWFIVLGLVLFAALGLLLWLREGSPFLEAFMTVLLGIFLGGFWSYYLLRWISGRRRG